jgi:hypothetical protein
LVLAGPDRTRRGAAFAFAPSVCFFLILWLDLVVLSEAPEVLLSLSSLGGICAFLVVVVLGFGIFKFVFLSLSFFLSFCFFFL